MRDMSKLYWSGFVFLFCAVLLSASPAFSQDKNKAPELFRLAIVDVDAIMRESSVVKGIRTQILEYRKKYETEFKKEEQELRAANQDLAKKRTILSPEAFAEERRKFERRVVDVQRLVQVRKQDLEKVQGTAMAKVEATLNEIVSEIVKEQSLTLILRRNQAVFYSRQIDVTKPVLDRLNKRLPKIKVSEPGK